MALLDPTKLLRTRRLALQGLVDATRRMRDIATELGRPTIVARADEVLTTATPVVVRDAASAKRLVGPTAQRTVRRQRGPLRAKVRTALVHLGDAIEVAQRVPTADIALLSEFEARCNALRSLAIRANARDVAKLVAHDLATIDARYAPLLDATPTLRAAVEMLRESQRALAQVLALGEPDPRSVVRAEVRRVQAAFDGLVALVISETVTAPGDRQRLLRPIEEIVAEVEARRAVRKAARAEEGAGDGPEVESPSEVAGEVADDGAIAPGNDDADATVDAEQRPAEGSSVPEPQGASGEVPVPSENQEIAA